MKLSFLQGCLSFCKRVIICVYVAALHLPQVHALDERIEDFGAAIAAALPTVAGDILTTSLNDITSSSPVWAVGRIVPEAEGAPLNEASLLLEGCREASGGARVRLDVSHMPHGGAAGMPALRLFPGQCVAVMGLNPTGHTFIAQRVVTHLPAQPRAQAAAVVVDTADAATAGAEPLAEAGAAAAGSAVSSGLSMVVAAGPFTTSDSMAYEPLSDLLAYCTGGC